jgi:hypothetical protein
MTDQLLKPGFAWFDIIQADDTRQDGSPLISKNGALMLKLTLNCTDTQGNTLRVYDYIIEGIEWKILSLQKSINTEDPILVIPNDGKKSPYWDKRLLAKFRNGVCSIRTDISKDERYGDKSVIAAYLPEDICEKLNVKYNEPINELPDEVVKDTIPGTYISPAASSSASDDDDIPF